MLSKTSAPAAPAVTHRPTQVRGLARTAGVLALAAALTLSGGLLTGCGSSLSHDQLGPPVAQQTLTADQQQAMRFEMVPNSVRVDVVRQTHEETHCSTDSKGNESCTTTTENDPYQPMGVYLGKGLFLDAGLNLSVVPDRVYHGPVVPQDFHKLELKGPFGEWSKSVVTQEGNTVGISKSLTFFDNKVVRDGPDKTTLELGTFKSFQKFNNIVITRHGEDINIQAWAPNVGLLQSMQRIEIHQHGDTTTVHPFGPKTLVNTDIVRHGDQVTVQPFGGKLTRTDITKGPGEEIHVKHFGIGEEITERGQSGMNETSKALGLSSRSNIEIHGNQYIIHEPGPFGTSTIQIQP